MKEFKGTKGEWHAVNYGGYWNIQDSEYYGESNLLDAEKVGEDIAEQNAKLAVASPILLEALQQLLHLHLCEQEGLSSGQPTFKDWMEAYDKGVEAINKALD